MKLYYSPASCAMSPHIVLCETGLAYELDRVDLATKTTASGRPLSAINDQDAVPALELASGEVLTEGAAIVQYIADQQPEAGLIPPAGSLERARVQQWLNYIATEMHKAHVPLFKADYPAVTKEIATASVRKSYDYVSGKLSDRPFLTGDRFTVADAYLFTILNWHGFIGLDLAAWPVLKDFHERVAARPAVVKAMAEEGLIESAAA